MSESDTELEIKRLEALGYDRKDIQVLPDGTLTIVHHDEMKSSHATIERATAKDRLEKMIERKNELNYMATAAASAGHELDPEIEKEFLQLSADIEATIKLIKEEI